MAVPAYFVFFHKSELDRVLEALTPLGDIMVEAIEEEDPDRLSNYLAWERYAETQYGRALVRRHDLEAATVAVERLKRLNVYRGIVSGSRPPPNIRLEINGQESHRLNLHGPEVKWFSLLEDSQGRSVVAAGLLSPDPDIAAHFLTQLSQSDRIEFARHYQSVLDAAIEEEDFVLAAAATDALSAALYDYWRQPDEVRILSEDQYVALEFSQAFFAYLAGSRGQLADEAENEAYLASACNRLFSYLLPGLRIDRPDRYSEQLPNEDEARLLLAALEDRPSLREGGTITASYGPGSAPANYCP